jgi:hypothetical protein
VVAGAHGLGVEALAVVADVQLQPAVGLAQLHAHMAGLGVAQHIGQRLLHQPVQGQAVGVVAGVLGQLQAQLQAGALGELGGQDLQRRDQAQVGQRRRTQVLDDAALQCDALVQQLAHVLEPLIDLGRRGLGHAADAGHVQLGGGQQRTQLVVQLAGQVGALVFAHGLQVAGQLGQLGRAVGHFAVQPVALAGQLGGMFAAGLVQGLVAAQEHGQPEQAQQREAVHAEAAVGQRLEHRVALARDLRQLVPVQLRDGVAHGLHLLAADVALHQALPGRRVAVAVELDDQLQLGELLVGAQAGVVDQRGPVAAFVLAAQPLQHRGQLALGLLHRGQVVLPAGQQEAALRGLGAGQQLAQAQAVVAGEVAGLGLLERLVGTPEGGLADAHDGGRGQCGQAHGQAAVARGSLQPGVEMTQHRASLNRLLQRHGRRHRPPVRRNS